MIYSSQTSSKLRLISLLIVLIFQIKQVFSYSLINCYSSLPSGFTKDNSDEFQSSSLCHTTCSGKGYSYFALADHSDCYCGNSSPAGLSISSSCNTNCNGYGQEMCGGTSAYSIYAEDNVEAAAADDTQSSAADTTTLAKDTTTTNAATPSTTSTNLVSTPKTKTKTTVNALAADASASHAVVVVATNSQATQNEATSGTNIVTSVEPVVATSVVYSTQLQTQGGSTIFVTNTITKSTQVLPTGNNSSTNANTSAKNKKKVNTGAIVGGVVGGVCGAIVIAVIVLLGLRHYNMKREEDRMEKEYQEAIKPVEYNPNDVLSSSSHSYSFDGGNMQGKLGHDMNMMNDSIGMTTLPANNMMDGSSNNSNNSNTNNNISDGNELNNNNNNNNNNTTNHLAVNPFDDSRRISTGSIITDDTDTNRPAKLTIVNPDE